MQCSMLHSRCLARPHQPPHISNGNMSLGRSLAAPRRRRMQLQAMQAGWNPQQQPQQPMQPQQQQMPPQARQPMPLARTQPPYQAAGPVFLELTQVLNKQVITRTSGRCLGCISGAWLDPAAGTLVSFDLDERRQASGGLGSLSTPPRAGNIPLSALRQIGDVVLVHDESGLYEQDLDGRLGFVNPVGLDVRTRAGEFLGKVRDLSFSPDSGAIRRITYDEFGLPFLPISFFDCYSVAMQDVISIGRGELLVYDDAKYRERKESAGLFAAIPSLFKSLNGPSRSGGSQLALPAPGGTSDMYRLGGPGSTTGSSSSSSSRFLPSDYTYEQWQADLRRWEAETGMTYEQYLRAQGQQPGAAGPRNALPPGRSTGTPGYGAMGTAGAAAYGAQQYGAGQQQQRQPGYMQPQQQGQQPQQQQVYQQQQQQPALGQQQGVPAWQQPQQPQQQPQQQYAPRPGQQQYAAGFGQQAPAGGFSGGQQPAGAAPAGYAAAAGARPGPTAPTAAGAGQQQAFGGGAAPQQQQQRAAVRQQPQQQARPATQPQQPLGSTGGAAPAAARSQPQQQAASGAGSSQPAMQGQRQQWQPTQQQQQPAGDASSRPVDDWLVRETRPRIADALADGVLPSSEDAPAPSAAGLNGQQQAQQQRELA